MPTRSVGAFASGLSVDYGASVLVAKTEDAKAKQQRLAPGLPLGMRFNSFKVLNQACARPWYL